MSSKLINLYLVIGRNIVAIQEPEELNKYIYFPMKENEKINFGQYETECVEIEENNFFVKRLIKIKFLKVLRKNKKSIFESYDSVRFDNSSLRSFKGSIKNREKY